MACEISVSAYVVCEDLNRYVRVEMWFVITDIISIMLQRLCALYAILFFEFRVFVDF